jgi:hypothetical protein
MQTVVKLFNDWNRSKEQNRLKPPEFDLTWNPFLEWKEEWKEEPPANPINIGMYHTLRNRFHSCTYTSRSDACRLSVENQNCSSSCWSLIWNYLMSKRRTLINITCIPIMKMNFVVISLLSFQLWK